MSSNNENYGNRIKYNQKQYPNVSNYNKKNNNMGKYRMK